MKTKRTIEKIGKLSMRIVLAFLLTFTNVPYPEKAAQADITQGLIGHWTFDDGEGIVTTDSSGNGYHGTLVNDPAWTAGIFNGALRFDGTDDYVNVPDIIASNQGSILVWIKPARMINQIVFDAGEGDKYFNIVIDANWNEHKRADLDEDGTVGIRDLITVARNFGTGV